jgi:hypothetical protein
MFAEMYERARSELPDEDPARGFEDRGVRLETTFAATAWNKDKTKVLHSHGPPVRPG